MPEFLYKAQNTQGNVFQGSLEAKDKAEAEAMLLRRRLVITSLKKKPTEIKIKIGSFLKDILSIQYNQIPLNPAL